MEAPPSSVRGWRFWSIIISLTIANLLSALDISAISTAMPSIVEEIGADPAYVWIVNAYMLTTTAFQPLFGQMANIYGRRILTLLAVFLFAAGSAICGPAPNLATLVVGRAIKGVGGGGLVAMVEIIISDLLPVRERPKYLSIIFIAFTFALSLGPLIGGALAEKVTWRWVFYINLPLATVAFVMLAFSLRVRHERSSTMVALKRIDLGGNLILIGIQAALDESDTAVATATWGFVRSFGGIWGVAIPSAIFNSNVDKLLVRINNTEMRNMLRNGGAYSLASGAFMSSLNSDPELKTQVKSVYVDSLKLCWQVGLSFALLGFLVALAVKEIPMRTELQTQFGMEEQRKTANSEELQNLGPPDSRLPRSSEQRLSRQRHSGGILSGHRTSENEIDLPQLRMTGFGPDSGVHASTNTSAASMLAGDRWPDDYDPTDARTDGNETEQSNDRPT
ncbi:hypothetical protein SLS62_008065 [Diatrype stigma]|uniref:Major facilitator superfamily (MFS) profile domain-containing protein n=1 Tax=Diatrype stigma TaxID=117547 RepID=A0AAN9UNU3_9PEZI